MIFLLIRIPKYVHKRDRSNLPVCSNFFMSNKFKDFPMLQANKQNSDSVYTYFTA